MKRIVPRPALLAAVLSACLAPLCATALTMIYPPPTGLVETSPVIMEGVLTFPEKNTCVLSVERCIKGDSAVATIPLVDREVLWGYPIADVLAERAGQHVVVFGEIVDDRLTLDYVDYSVWPLTRNLEANPIASLSSARLTLDTVKRYTEAREKGTDDVFRLLLRDVEDDERRWIALDYIYWLEIFRQWLDIPEDYCTTDDIRYFACIVALKAISANWTDIPTHGSLMTLGSGLPWSIQSQLYMVIGKGESRFSAQARDMLQKHTSVDENGRTLWWGRLATQTQRHEARFALAEMLDSPIPTLHDNAPSVLQAILGIDSVPDESRFTPEFWKAKIEEQP